MNTTHRIVKGVIRQIVKGAFMKKTNTTNNKVCTNCDYFEPYSEYIAENCGFIGLCHRYPDYRNVADGHWCGEWKDKNDN